MSNAWHTTSWLDYPDTQGVRYKDSSQLTGVVDELCQKPPLVAVKQIKALQDCLANAALGKAFVIQAGDCAEAFSACSSERTKALLNLVNQISNKLERVLGQPITPIGRIAGQYAKPRTKLFETRENIILPSYRGDLINDTAFCPNAREPDPKRLIQGYHHAQQTYQWIEASRKERAFYTSHEALQLHYESALTRRTSDNRFYNFSTHLPWLGMRTTQIDGAHVEYLRGIENPIGIKIGPSMTGDELVTLIQHLNPNHIAGRILLITRLGAKHIHNLLPALIRAVKKHKLPVTWASDPMHGNSEFTEKGVKTRKLENIWSELESTFRIHQENHSILGGIHLELTPEEVTECIGGHAKPTPKDLSANYQSLLDPRLNPTQALEITSKLSKYLLGTMVNTHGLHQSSLSDAQVAHQV